MARQPAAQCPGRTPSRSAARSAAGKPLCPAAAAAAGSGLCRSAASWPYRILRMGKPAARDPLSHPLQSQRLPRSAVSPPGTPFEAELDIMVLLGKRVQPADPCTKPGDSAVSFSTLYADCTASSKCSP
ncbi:hypothetical protein WJX73_003887 [Symbiochloris irregularis]|uniref:Uncharacterized protein n=1 Tax=Symbiochloris irregularis TaxID=706552 RepID=A0AAW1NJ10_9CHLO